MRELEFRPEDIWWERKPGQIELNPLLLARIMERVQFDGDVPELRWGNLPEGGKPAVPVVADTTDPVLLGLMLDCASLDVQDELVRVRKAWELGEAAKGELAVPEKIPVFSVPGYEPGQIPARRLSGILPGDAALLTEPEKKLAAFTAISTTQGRVSSIPAISRLIREALEARGLSIREAPPRKTVSSAEWRMELPSAAEDINPRFSPQRTAAANLARDLLRRLPQEVSSVSLVVKPINWVHERTVGWRAYLYV